MEQMSFSDSNFHATNKINLSKLKRCNQIWDDMPVCEQGRLCEKCDHVIIDFRHKSDYEIAKIHTLTPGKVCGLYTKKQLKPRKKLNQSFIRWKSACIGLMGFLYANPLASQIQSDTVKVVQVQSENNKPDSVYSSERQKAASRDSIIISGKVIDTSGEELWGTSVLLVNTTTGTITDLKGNYSLNLTEIFEKEDEIALEFSYVGFATRRIEAITRESLEHTNGVLDIVLEEGFTYYYGVVRLPWYKRAWNKVKSVFRRKR